MEIIKYLLTVLLALCCLDVLLVKCNEKIKSVSNKDNENEEEEYSVFEPTSEWKPLRKDQAIPRGLHVRMNLATGKREAKLLDPDEKNDDEMHDITTVPGDTKEENQFRGLTAIEEAWSNSFKKIWSDETLIAEDDLEKVKTRFRSYGPKEPLETDTKMIKDLFSNYKDLAEKKASPIAEEFKEEFDQKELAILTDLEYLVHDTDNAMYFVSSFALTDIVFSSLNSTSSKVRYEATKVLGAAVQNNPYAQVTALRDGSISILLRTLATDSSYQVKFGALYSLSCLVRRFPSAQRTFVLQGGLNTLSKLFSSKSSDQIKLQMKIVSFINDLLLEKNYTLLTLLDTEDRYLFFERALFYMNELGEESNQYENINLIDRLKEGGWCIVFCDLFQSIAYNLAMNPEQDVATANGDEPARLEHESVEKLASVITSLMSSCHENFSRLSPVASDLFVKYSQLVKIENDPDSIFAQLQNTIANLSDALLKYNVKDEL